MSAEQPRVLSIQSHVVSGYVGNKSATFPLQLLGFEVDAINSVQFCNHTGYAKGIKGQVLSDVDLGDLVEGLHLNNLDDGYTHLLTGYIGSPLFLQRVAAVVKHLKTINPGLIYVCDPVMGDNGQMYVPKELLPLYQNTIIPLADIITPNQFEVEQLTGCKINSVADAWNAIDILHGKGCKTVVLSSSDLGNDGNLLALASSSTGDKRRITLEIPKFSGSFTGSGDLFAALFLAWMHKSNNIETALEKTIATLQAVLQRTLTHAKKVGVTPRSLELKLIQSKGDIENPLVEVKVARNNN